MTKDEFELLFDEEVAEPLGQRGFKRVGKSLYTTENLDMGCSIRGRSSPTPDRSAVAPLTLIHRRSTSTMPQPSESVG
jgi:hypothetical protein